MQFNLFKFILTGILIISITSCDQEDIKVTGHPDITLKSRSAYNIPVDSALSYLYEFLNDPENKSFGNKRVASITPIKYSLVASRSQEAFLTDSVDSIDCDNLIYIANFDNGKGFAVLAADYRIEDKVIAVTESGSLSDSVVYSSLQPYEVVKPIYPNYPTTGAGFYTLPEYGNELFMNPNTVSLYIEEEQDTLVGNYISYNDNDPDIIDEFGNQEPQHDSEAIECCYSVEYLASSLCTNYAINQILNYNKRPNGPVRFKTNDEDHDDLSDGAGWGAQYYKSPWETLTQTPNLLRKYRYWHQGDPFNGIFPKRLSIQSFKFKKVPVGCFPLALAKILTFFQYPDHYYYNGQEVNWEGLNRSEYTQFIDTLSVQILLKGISEGCHSWYFAEGTFTFPHSVSAYMRNMGISNSHNQGYDFDRVVDMIDNGKPIVISSVPGINLTGSHSWNIYGYKIKHRTIKHYENSILKTIEYDTCRMVHCDFGWGEELNGYYVSGVFKLDDSNSEKDRNDDPKVKTNFNHIIRIITYDKPRQ